METATAIETTRRVVIERDIPEPAVAGLVEFIDRYYIRSKTRFIQDLSYRKTASGAGPASNCSGYSSPLDQSKRLLSP